MSVKNRRPFIGSMITLVHFFVLCSCRSVSVYYNENEDRFNVVENSYDHVAPARAIIFESVTKTGWTELHIETPRSCSDQDVCSEAAGVAEGYLTADLFDNHMINVQNELCRTVIHCKPDGSFPDVLTAFMKNNSEWTERAIDGAGSSDFITAARLFQKQISGLTIGYNFSRGKSLDRSLLWTYLSADMLPDIARTLGVAQSGSENFFPRMGTGFISHPGDFRDLLIAHTSWSGYGISQKIAKRYRVRHGLGWSSIDRRSCSSLPFVIHGGDDFQMGDNGMLIMSSPVGISNSVISSVSYEGIPHWLRALAATQVSNSSGLWIENYNHEIGLRINGIEYLIIDSKRLVFGDRMRDNAIVIVDEIINMTRAQDFTDRFAKDGYFAIYNIPRIDEVYQRAGYSDLAAIDRLLFDQNQSARKLIFEDYIVSSKVRDLASLKQLIRLNNPQVIARQRGRYIPAVAARGDLEVPDGKCGGAVDGKVTSLTRMLHLQWEGINSPSYDELVPFNFTTATACTGVKHQGIPDALRFSWIPHYFDLDFEVEP
jgi:hypothetical protein